MVGRLRVNGQLDPWRVHIANARYDEAAPNFKLNQENERASKERRAISDCPIFVVSNSICWTKTEHLWAG
jgi:hypothetical protein